MFCSSVLYAECASYIGEKLIQMYYLKQDIMLKFQPFYIRNWEHMIR
jgi:hypothetical protein